MCRLRILIFVRFNVFILVFLLSFSLLLLKLNHITLSLHSFLLFLSHHFLQFCPPRISCELLLILLPLYLLTFVPLTTVLPNCLIQELIICFLVHKIFLCLVLLIHHTVPPKFHDLIIVFVPLPKPIIVLCRFVLFLCLTPLLHELTDFLVSKLHTFKCRSFVC